MAQGNESNSAKPLLELSRRGYSDDEINTIYELGRLYLTCGNLKAAENIMAGLSQAVPDYAPGWMGLCYIHCMNKENEAALSAARQALRVDPASSETHLFLITCLLTVGDYNSAGTYLGEVGEKIDNGEVENPLVVRFFKAQLARYQGR